jgi:hypothetical protein
MTAAAVDCGVDTDALLGDYLDYVASLGLGERAVRDRTRIAREFLSRNPNLPAWMALPAAPSGPPNCGRAKRGHWCATRSAPTGSG